MARTAAGGGRALLLFHVSDATQTVQPGEGNSSGEPQGGFEEQG